ncbi:hypothetical protein AAFF_G00062710 [Aldrovandia affinis]|uniref:AB hydrolase-1 domain-containing protein n=1 Tax=Aldrovandia affinis TaxID=143900 RepID=A0AAD7RZI7_9TELE|nr:hypothetical protein AAFF_G00062710 [Aldrovandia affinis]
MPMKKRSSNQGPKPSPIAKARKSAGEKKVETKVPTSGCWSRRIIKALIALCVCYVSVPFMLRLFPVILSHLVYAHKFRIPFFVDLSRPEDLSLNHTVNFYLTPEEGITLGVWHTVPDSQWREAQGKDMVWYQESLEDGPPIIIYLHGNGGTRGASHRVAIVNVLAAAGFHVLSLDYRGFGESTGAPTEAGLTTDALYVHEWVKARSGNSLVCLWGHSLGTGVATNAAVQAQEQGGRVDAVVLENPFTNVRETGVNHPFAWFYWKFPGFDYFFLDTLALTKLVFPTDENLKKMDSHLLILHAEDDHLVPFQMGQTLFEIARQAQGSEQKVQMVPFSGSLGYLHNGIHKDPSLPQIVREFLQPLID